MRTFRAGVGRGVRRTVLHAALVAGRRSGRGEARARRARRGHSGRGIGVRRRDFGPGTWRRRTDCIHRSARQWDCPSRATGPRRWGIRRHVRDRAVDGLGRGALVAGRRGIRDAGGRRLRRDRDPERHPRWVRPPLRIVRRAPRQGRRSRARSGPGRGTAAAEGSQPGGGSGAAGRRRSRLHRRAHRRGHGAGVRRRRTAGGLRCARTARGLRPPVAQADPSLPDVDRGASFRRAHTLRCARASSRPHRRCPSVFTRLVNLLAQ